MTSATWYLVFAIVGLACTAVAMRPPHRPAWLMAATFFTAWLTTELALWIIFWQIVITAAFVVFGALDSWPGWLGLALTVVSCVRTGTDREERTRDGPHLRGRTGRRSGRRAGATR